MPKNDNAERKELKIFIASSGEMKEEREKIEAEIRRRNDDLQGALYLKPILWEQELQAIQKDVFQATLNKELLSSDVAVVMIYKNVGQFTLEEFHEAHKSLKAGNKPRKMYVYFKKFTPTYEELEDEEFLAHNKKRLELKKEIKQHEDIYNEVANTNELLYHFSKQLDLIIKGDNSVKPYPRNRTGALPLIPENYKDWIRGECENLDVQKLIGRGKEPLKLNLPDIYVPLFGNDPKDLHSKQKTLSDAVSDSVERKIEAVEINELIVANDYLLISGHPGSGKTTLLRHLAWQIVQGEGPEQLKDYLPVIVFLRRFSGVKPEEIHSAKSLLLKYLDENISNWDDTLFTEYSSQKKVLILLDGLDEVPEPLRNRIVDIFNSFKNTSKNRLVLAGRPHGVEGAAFSKFGKNHVSVNPLNKETIEEFIRKWHTFVYSQSNHKAEKTANGMISEITSKETVRHLIGSPLMLTAVCILYNFDMELPNQRAELYLRFIEHLVEKQFDNSVLPHSFLRLLAFRMQKKGTRQCYSGEALSVFREVYEKNDGEKELVYNGRTEKMFREIEPKCGLLKFENDQYSFWHWTIQEFLVADYLVNTSENHLDRIKGYWDEENYKEVVKLYIGILGLSTPGISAGIINSVMKDENAPYERVGLIADALVDIESPRRVKETVNQTRTRLWGIIHNESDPKKNARLGEITGWLGDDRDDLKDFIKIPGGSYDLEKLGKKEIKSFEICKYPVTNMWYKEFMDHFGYEEKSEKYWSEEGWAWRNESTTRAPHYWEDKEWNCPNAPVVGVSWYEADAFCRWYTDFVDDNYIYRLLTEKEWQAAAVGKNNREYPWEGEWDKNFCNNYDLDIHKTTSVGIFKKGRTPENVYDMAGNVWEWCDRWYDKKGDFRVLRGGSWFYVASICRSAYRGRIHPYYRSYDIGFRLAQGQNNQQE